MTTKYITLTAHKCNNSDISSKAKVGCSSGKLEPSHPTVYHKQMIK
jgi:hypothetical protein